MCNKINCRDFFAYWEQICTENESEIIDAWESGSWGKYTDVILGKANNSSILVQIQQKIDNIDFYQEYYSCDAVFFYPEDCLERKDLEKILPPIADDVPPTFAGTWLKKIRIHFEHENDIKTSWHEIIQICNIPGELNVLVTYPNNDEKRETLRCYERILSSTDFTKRLLVIFGTHTKGTKEANWEGHEYDHAKKMFNQL